MSYLSAKQIRIVILGCALSGIVGTVRAELILDQPPTAPVVNPAPAAPVPVAPAPIAPVAAAPAPAQVAPAAQAPTVVVVQQPMAPVAPQAQAAPVQVAPAAQAPLAPLAPATQAPVVAAEQDDLLPGEEAGDTRMNRAEIYRRARMRREIRNEDYLRSRLEELRLREEERLTKQILGAQGTDAVPAAQAAPQPAAQPMPVQTVVVTPPAAPTDGDQAAGSSSSFLHVGEGGIDHVTFSFSPAAGVAFATQAQGFEVTPRFATGGMLMVNLNQHFSIEAGYQYSLMGAAFSSNLFVNNYRNWAMATGMNPTMDTLLMQQHTAEGGVRVYFTKSDFRFRPFVIGGAGYSWGITGYTPQIQTYLRSQGLTLGANNYTSQTVQGVVGGGLDVQITRSIAVGIQTKLYIPIYTQDNYNLYQGNSPYTYGPYNPFVAYNNTDQRYVGSAMANAPLISVLLGTTFTF